MRTVTIAGRKFKPVTDSTIEHDVWTMELIKKCGLDVIEMYAGEAAEEFAHRVFMQASKDMAVFDLLGGLLMPIAIKPENWTPELAHETGRHFALVCDPEEKKAIRSLIAEALMGFFAKGLSRLKTSPKSSKSEEAKPQPSGHTGELSSMEPGPDSSANWPETIRPACEPS